MCQWDLSLSRGRAAFDTIRAMTNTTGRDMEVAAIRRLMTDRGLTKRALSLAGKRNDTYIHQFLEYGRPQRLQAEFRETIAELYNLDPVTLNPLVADLPNTAPAYPVLPLRHEMPQDVPVMGSGTGGGDGAMNFNGTIDYVRRPPSLSMSRDVYAVYVVGESMEPRYFSGDPVFVSPHRPVRVGDHVIVQCRDGDNLVAFVKVTRGRRGGKWIFGQYNPAGEWTPPGPIHSVHRIFTNSDIFTV